MQKTEQMFDLWNDRAKDLEFHHKSTIDCVVGEFWRYYEGVNIGNEISKDDKFKRVCLVLKNDIGNGLVLICPITSKNYDEIIKNRVKILGYEKYSLRTPSCLINQIKLVDKKRLSHKLSVLAISLEFVKKILRLYIYLIQKTQ